MKVVYSPSIFLRDMDGTSIGVWVAHGEGRAVFPSEEVRQMVMKERLAPIR